MRTKTILLSAACGLLGSLAANAGSVYSVNVVGYVNKTFTGAQFTMFGNPLNSANTVSNLFSSFVAADYGSKLFVWNTTTKSFDYASFTGSYDPNETGLLDPNDKPVAGWTDSDGYDANSRLLAPGQGAWLFVPTTKTVTFVGDVLTGTLSTPIVLGWSQIASKVPQSGDITALGLTSPTSGDKIFKYVNGGFDIRVYTPDFSQDGETPGWYDYDGNPSIPTLDVADAVWYNSAASTTWTRTFSINQ